MTLAALSSIATTPITARFDDTPVGVAFARVLALASAGFETDFGYEVTPDGD